MRGRALLFGWGLVAAAAQGMPTAGCGGSVDWAQSRPVVASLRTADEPSAQFWANGHRDGVVSVRALRDDPSFRRFLFEEPVQGQVQLGEYAGIYQREGRYSGHLSFAIGASRKKYAQYPYGRRLISGWGHSLAHSSAGYRDLSKLIAAGPYAEALVPWGTESSYSFHLDFDAFPGADDDEKLRLFLTHVDELLHRLEN